jgi:hypothetical protein
MARVAVGICTLLGSHTIANAFVVNHNNTVPGVVANSLIATGNGADWNSAEILMVLSAGSVYNDPTFDSLTPQKTFWGVFPDLEFDSWVGIPGDTTTSILGGAGDLGDEGPAVIADQKVSVTWFNTNITDTGVNRIANISLTDDARGTFTVIAGFSPNVLLQKSGWVVNGVAYFELPGDLNNDGFVGIGDLNIVLGSWNQTVTPNSIADPSGDGFVGINDLNEVLGFWNAGTPPAAGAAVPEPASFGLMMLAAGACLRRRTC